VTAVAMGNGKCVGSFVGCGRVNGRCLVAWFYMWHPAALRKSLRNEGNVVRKAGVHLHMDSMFSRRFDNRTFPRSCLNQCAMNKAGNFSHS
jgi:hypothetical protein